MGIRTVLDFWRMGALLTQMGVNAQKAALAGYLAMWEPRR